VQEDNIEWSVALALGDHRSVGQGVEHENRLPILRSAKFDVTAGRYREINVDESPDTSERTLEGLTPEQREAVHSTSDACSYAPPRRRENLHVLHVAHSTPRGSTMSAPTKFSS
jgi:hypothetical protein